MKPVACQGKTHPDVNRDADSSELPATPGAKADADGPTASLSGAARSRRVEWKKRIGAAAVAAACLAVLAAAGHLRPSANLAGTHQQIGLPACSFMVNTGMPCPTCGITTAFAAMAHAEVLVAWRAQPFGAALFVAVSALLLAGAVQAATGMPMFKRLRLRWWAWGLVIGLPAGWGIKMLAGLADGTLPAR
jgi:hypothetical protein